MGTLGNVKKQYLISLFHSLIPAYVIERLFWQERGMNVQMVVYAEIIYAATVILLEIPSGILSDKFGRKKLLVLDGLLSACELLILLFANRFWMFALAICLSGVGKALSSGSENALLYDSLLASGKEADFEKHLGRIAAIDFAGSIIAALSGSLLASFLHMEFNYMLSVGSMLLSFLVALTLVEPPMLTRSDQESTDVRHYVKESVSVFLSKPTLLIYVTTGAILGACRIYLDEFWQLILGEINVPVAFFGVVSAAIMLCGIPGNLLAHKLKRRFRFVRLLTTVIAVNILCYAGIFVTRNLLCLLPIFVISLAAGVTDPLVMGYLHHNTESGVRATVESFFSLGLRLISVLVGLGFGAISTAYSVLTGFGLLTLFCTLYLCLFLFWKRIEKTTE